MLLLAWRLAWELFVQAAAEALSCLVIKNVCEEASATLTRLLDLSRRIQHTTFTIYVRPQKQQAVPADSSDGPCWRTDYHDLSTSRQHSVPYNDWLLDTAASGCSQTDGSSLLRRPIAAT